MKYSDAVKLLDSTKWKIQSKFGINKGKKVVFYDWFKVDGGFEFHRTTEFREYKNTLVYSSHDWKKQNGYVTKTWVTISSDVEVLFSGRGSEMLEFMTKYDGDKL